MTCRRLQFCASSTSPFHDKWNPFKVSALCFASFLFHCFSFVCVCASSLLFSYCCLYFTFVICSLSLRTVILRASFSFFSFVFISWRLLTLQYCGGFCHTLTWISHGFTCAPHPDPPSRLPPHPLPLGLPSAPAPSTCLKHPTWAGGLFHNW